MTVTNFDFSQWQTSKSFKAKGDFEFQRGIFYRCSIVSNHIIKRTVFALGARDGQTDGQTDHRIAASLIPPPTLLVAGV